MAKDDYSKQEKWYYENMERFSVKLYKGRKSDLANYAAEHGIPLNRLVINALEAYTGIPVSKKKIKNSEE